MSFLGSIFPGDKELGKKDDDHRPGASPTLPGAWHARKQVSGMRRRRIIYTALGLLALFLFYQNIPADLGSNSEKGDVRVPQKGSLQQSPHHESPTDKPPHGLGVSEAEEHYFSGPVKFYKLAASLHGVAMLAGRGGKNKNILFAASNLKSAAAIMPMACVMAVQKRNDVHFAFMGREELEIHEIKEINGINDDDCPVNWHDARPDYSRWSTDYRMEFSVKAGIGHIDRFIAPQALVIDHLGREDTFFVNAARSKALVMGKSLIELPSDAVENMMWLTRLDSGSLAAWQLVYIDLLVQAPPESSGSLVRLLKSVEAADHFGYRRPHLTIELPTDIDGPTDWYLQNLIWPPLDWSGAPHASQVTLRHRIPKRTFTAAEASSYFVESFYPARPDDSHVIVLSPQAELSPLYYHYLMYNLLEYKYSKSRDTDSLIGISLELPSTYLNSTDAFDPPHPKGKPNTPTPFQWQAPSSNAALYFGDAWIEFHSYLSHRISTMTSKTPKYIKQISTSQPAWMEYFLELMRARGYTMLYPNYASTSSNALAIVHTELYQPPEEYSRDRRKASKTHDPPPNIDPTNPFTADPATESLTPPHSSEPDLLTTTLLDILPKPGDLPPLSSLPILSHDGFPMTPSSRGDAASLFASTIRREIGGCVFKDGKMDAEPEIYARSADDLFCTRDQVGAEVFADLPSSPSPTPQDSTAHSNDVTKGYTPPKPVTVDNVDVIPPEQVEQMNNEFSTHLQRQSGEAPPPKQAEDKEGPRIPGPSAEDITRGKAKYKTAEEISDESLILKPSERDNAQDEFFKHLNRQKAEDNKAGDADGRKEAKVEDDDDVGVEEEEEENGGRVMKYEEVGDGDTDA